jgi:hypothetical protein
MFYAARGYYERLKNHEKFSHIELSGIERLVKELTELCVKAEDMNSSKQARKMVRSEFPRDLTNVKSLVQELSELLNAAQFGTVYYKDLIWDPDLPEVEFLDSEEDLSDHLPVDEFSEEEPDSDSSDTDFEMGSTSHTKISHKDENKKRKRVKETKNNADKKVKREEDKKILEKIKIKAPAALPQLTIRNDSIRSSGHLVIPKSVPVSLVSAAQQKIPKKSTKLHRMDKTLKRIKKKK